MAQVWASHICILRPKTIAFYTLLGDQRGTQIGHAGLSVSEKGEGHKVIAQIEAGSGADFAGDLRAGDVIVGVDGMSVETMRACDVDALLAGPSRSSVVLSVCRSADVQAVCVYVCVFVCFSVYVSMCVCVNMSVYMEFCAVE